MDSPRIVRQGLVHKLHFDLVEDVLEVVLACRQLQVLVPMVGSLEHDDVAIHQFVQSLAACTRLNPSGGRLKAAAATMLRFRACNCQVKG